jgi:hypothetical protein
MIRGRVVVTDEATGATLPVDEFDEALLDRPDGVLLHLGPFLGETGRAIVVQLELRRSTSQ